MKICLIWHFLKSYLNEKIKELNYDKNFKNLIVNSVHIKISAQNLYFIFSRYLKSTRLSIDTADALNHKKVS